VPGGRRDKGRSRHPADCRCRKGKWLYSLHYHQYFPKFSGLAQN